MRSRPRGDSGMREAAVLARLACELEAQAATGEWPWIDGQGRG